MKKQVKKIVFVGVVVVLLLAAWFILKKIIPEKEKDKGIVVTDLKATDYSFVSIKGPDSDYTFHIGKLEPSEENGLTEAAYYLYDGGVYDDEKAFGYYEQAELAKAFDRTTQLSALALVDEAPEDYAEYGLDQAHATVVMVSPYDDADAERFTLLIGSHNTVVSGEGYYCQLAGSPEVYLISTLNAGTFLSGPAKFLSVDILPRFGEYYDEIKSIRITNRAGDEILVKRFETYGDHGEGVVVYTSFYMEEPYSCYVSDSVLGEEMLDLISNTQVMQVVAMDPDEEQLKAYGFENGATLEFSLVSGDHTYRIGTPAGASSGVYYLMLDDYKNVYMAYGTATFVDITAVKMRSGLAWIHGITNVEQLDITTPTGSYTLFLDDTRDNASGTGTWVGQIRDNSTGVQTILSESNGRALYGDCIGTTYDDLMVDEEHPIAEETPSYVLKVKYKNSDFTSTVRFYRVTSRQYAVLFDDADFSQAGFTVNVGKLKEISEDLSVIAAGGVIK